MGKVKKRSKSYYINNAKRKRLSSELSANMTGFLCTSNAKEQHCGREAYNLLNDFANILYGREKSTRVNTAEKEGEQVDEKKLQNPEENNSDCSDTDDLDLNLKKEIEDLRKCSKIGSERNGRFEQKLVRARGCVFIETTLTNPVELCLAIMNNVLETKAVRTKNLVRMVPVQRTCKAFIDDIEKASKQLIIDYFPKDKVTYYVTFQARNNSSLDRYTVLKRVSALINEVNGNAVAEYKTPDVVLNIDVIKNICCLGVLPEFMTKYHRNNLIRLAEK